MPAPIAKFIVAYCKNDLPDIYAPYYSSYNLGVNLFYGGFIARILPFGSFYQSHIDFGQLIYNIYMLMVVMAMAPNLNLVLVAMSESWAEDLSLQCARWYYGELLYTDVFLDINTTPAYSWIPWGIYYDLFDDSNSEPWDEVFNIGFKQMYSIFNNEINTPQKYKEALKANFDQVPR
ncbi:MAG: hypothetical protein IPQ19_01740 [Bacteroidetes bacterium]|nr:hypothetical protein [Bacteroidota bacterium]